MYLKKKCYVTNVLSSNDYRLSVLIHSNMKPIEKTERKGGFAE